MTGKSKLAAYTYILRCADGTLYTGWTKDPIRRLEQHNSGKGAKYTRGRLPVEMIYVEAYRSAAEAQRREVAIKRLPRSKKLELIKGRVYNEQTGNAYGGRP